MRVRGGQGRAGKMTMQGCMNELKRRPVGWRGSSVSGLLTRELVFRFTDVTIRVQEYQC